LSIAPDPAATKVELWSPWMFLGVAIWDVC